MKVNLDHEFKDFEGKIFPDPQLAKHCPMCGQEQEPFEPLTMKKMIIRAINVPEKQMAAEESIKRLTLSEDVFKASGEIDLKSEDVVLIKRMIPQLGYGPIVQGVIFRDLLKE